MNRKNGGSEKPGSGKEKVEKTNPKTTELSKKILETQGFLYPGKGDTKKRKPEALRKSRSG